VLRYGTGTNGLSEGKLRQPQRRVIRQKLGPETVVVAAHIGRLAIRRRRTWVKLDVDDLVRDKEIIQLRTFGTHSVSVAESGDMRNEACMSNSIGTGSKYCNLTPVSPQAPRSLFPMVPRPGAFWDGLNISVLLSS